MNVLIETKSALPDDSAVWLTQGERTLVYDSWNEYRNGDPHRQETFRVANPLGDFCYWCAFDGECLALTSPGDSCIAAVESALRAAGAGAVYVIWQPKDHCPANWARWQKKWAMRTAA